MAVAKFYNNVAFSQEYLLSLNLTARSTLYKNIIYKTTIYKAIG